MCKFLFLLLILLLPLILPPLLFAFADYVVYRADVFIDVFKGWSALQRRLEETVYQK
jgi:ABC-type Fe3+ transport system permease subunit